MTASPPPPGTAADLIALARRHVLPVYRPRELVLERGDGARLWDSEGREYVDLSSGIAVCGLGHNDPDLVEALVEQAGKLWHTSNVFYSEPPLRLVAELVEASGFATRSFLCNSGAEANEVAIKMVRKWASSQGRPADKRVIITFRGSFHGRTLGAVTATAQPKYQEGYEPLPGGFRYVDFNDEVQLETAMAAGDVAAVMLEPIQGEGGVMPARSGFLKRVRELCDQHNALLVLDEIQAGMGRTGTLFAHWQDDVVPDMVTLAKALGGGFPIGAMLAGPKVAETMQFGAHGTTFGGNPLAAAVARVALRKLASSEIAANVSRQSKALRDGFARINEEFGVFSEVISTFSGKPLFGYRSMIAATMAICLLSFMVWLHHFFTMGAGADVNGFFGITTMIIAVPTGVKLAADSLTSGASTEMPIRRHSLR